MTSLRFSPRWDGKEARLRELAPTGIGAAAIAAELGFTPNAVHCKAFALGIPIKHPARGPRPSVTPPPVPDVVPLVCAALEAEPAAWPGKPQQRAWWPLHVAAYILNVELEIPARHVGAAIGRDEKLVRYAVPRVEDRRDDPVFDAFMDRLADQAREMAA